MICAEKVDYHGITTNLPQKSGFSAHPACARFDADGAFNLQILRCRTHDAGSKVTWLLRRSLSRRRNRDRSA